MGVLPLELPSGVTWQSLGLTGEELFDIPQSDDALEPGGTLAVTATPADGSPICFEAKVRIDTAGGTRILPQWRNPADRASKALRDDSRITSQYSWANITAERDGYNRMAEAILESSLGQLMEPIVKTRREAAPVNWPGPNEWI